MVSVTASIDNPGCSYEPTGSFVWPLFQFLVLLTIPLRSISGCASQLKASKACPEVLLSRSAFEIAKSTKS